jgi:hypothetical protein
MRRIFTLYLLLSSVYLVNSYIPALKTSFKQSRGSTKLSSNSQNGNMGFKRSPGNMGIPQKNLQPQDQRKDDAFRTEARRRKVGPPNRGGNNIMKSREESLAAGRVSVYCIGAGLDLQALRAHVFRRGFGNQNVDVGSIVEVRTQRIFLWKLSICDSAQCLIRSMLQRYLILKVTIITEFLA